MVPYLRLPEMSEDTLGPCVRLDPGNLSGYLLIKGGEQLGDREIRARVRGCVGLGIHAGRQKGSRGVGWGQWGFRILFRGDLVGISGGPLRNAPTVQNTEFSNRY